RGQDEAHPRRGAGRSRRDRLDAPSDHRLRRHGDSQDQGEAAGGPANAGPAVAGVAGPLSPWGAGAGRMPAQEGVDESASYFEPTAWLKTAPNQAAGH